MAAWDAVFYEFEHRSPLSRQLVYAVSMLGDHPDILWRAGMVSDNWSGREVLRRRLADLSYPVVRRLVEVIDDHGIERGTVGQCVDVVLHEHVAPGEHLARAMNDITDPWHAECAAFLLAHLDPELALQELPRLARDSEPLRMVLAALRDGERLHLY